MEDFHRVHIIENNLTFCEKLLHMQQVVMEDMQEYWSRYGKSVDIPVINTEKLLLGKSFRAALPMANDSEFNSDCIVYGSFVQ